MAGREERSAGSGAVTYCVVPRDLAPKLHELLREHFRDDLRIEVVVERRRSERRLGSERRAEAQARDGEDRRRIRNSGGRRVGDRRAPAIGVEAPPLPRRARPYAERLLFVERVGTSSQRAEDLDTARLVTRIQAGDREAYGDLYLRYFDRIYAYLLIAFRNHHEAEELTQQVFLQVLQALPRYERRRQPFRAWLFTIVRHVAVAQLKRQQRVALEEPAAVARRRESGVDSDTHTQVLGWLADRELLLFVERLPATQRQVLMMRFMLDLSNREIADILGTTGDVVRQHQSRALRALRERLAAAGRVPPRHQRRTSMRRGIRQAQVLRARRFALSRRT
jgi:RNA polymerase sigma-70 factor (ECF subfamily)